MSATVPDYAGVTIGWRAWTIEPGPVLASVVHRAVWPPRERMEATCHRKHAVPDPACRCGIYAAASPEHLNEMGYPDHDISAARVVIAGEVALWGGLIPGEQGWRSQYAYPHRLYVPYEYWRLAKPLREDYGVPIRLANTFQLKEM
jgi:hypothetical protein